MKFNNLYGIVGNIDGFLSIREGELLYNLAKNCTGEGAIVEIGSWKGKSTICLGLGSRAGKQLLIYAIDPHSGSSEHIETYGSVWTFTEFQDNIKNIGLNDIVNPIVKTSKEAAEEFVEPVALVFIDGAHEYDLVKLDYQLWFPKVIEGGFMAFHDVPSWPGPTKVVDEFILKSGHFKNLGIIDSILFAQKVRTNSSVDRIRNRCVFSYAIFIRNVHNRIIRLKLPSNIRILLESICDHLSRFTSIKY